MLFLEGPDAEVPARSRLTEVSDGRGVGASRGVRVSVQERLNQELQPEIFIQWTDVFFFCDVQANRTERKPCLICGFGFRPAGKKHPSVQLINRT